jgi:DNA polymerase-3 subunit epsilon
MGDALATSKLFELIISIDCQILKEKSSNYPAALSKEVLKEIPSKTGIYYFKDSQNNIIYVGKSNDIHSRIISHLNNNTTKKAVEMKNNIASIEYELTGSELIALLFESDEIKRLKPIYNRAQRRSVFRYGLFTMIDENGYIQLNIDKIEEMSKPLTSFSSAAEAKEFMNMVIEEYELCQKLCGVYKTKGSCFNYQIKKCTGACIGEESADDYNKRVIMLMDKLELKYENFYLFEKGRKNGEKSFIKVENGVYKGFGFIEETKTQSNKQLDEKLILKSNNRDVQSIINSWMRRNKNEIRIF